VLYALIIAELIWSERKMSTVMC